MLALAPLRCDRRGDTAGVGDCDEGDRAAALQAPPVLAPGPLLPPSPAGGGVEVREAEGGEARDAAIWEGERAVAGSGEATAAKDDSSWMGSAGTSVAFTTTAATWPLLCFGGVGFRAVSRMEHVLDSGSKRLGSETPKGALIPHGLPGTGDRPPEGLRM